MRANFYPVDVPARGRLATMARPRGGNWLVDEMGALRVAGVDILVSALCDDERDLLDLGNEPHAARSAGLEFMSFPFADGGVPSLAQATEAAVLADRLTAHVNAGRFVVTHCRAGIGRCSILAGTVLVRLGLTPGEAWQRIRAARGLPVPDNPVQERWLHAFAPLSGARSARAGPGYGPPEAL